MQKTLFGAQPWQGPARGFKALGSPGVCNATSIEPIPPQILSATTPSPEIPAGATLDTLTPTLVVGTVGFLLLAGFGMIRF